MARWGLRIGSGPERGAREAPCHSSSTTSDDDERRDDRGYHWGSLAVRFPKLVVGVVAEDYRSWTG